MNKIKIINVVGARPNFMKIAPIIREMKQYGNINSLLVHTGQHYDENMSGSFFKDLGIPRPDIHLEVGSGTHAVQTASVMTGFEKVVLKEKPDIVLVVGDVNSTLACALVASKLNIKVAHIEAGLRSNDRSMPEEINRIVTDHLSDLLFTTCKDGDENLLREGISSDKVHLVGNVMIDTLLYSMNKIKPTSSKEKYAVLTLHRPSNVDVKETFEGISKAIYRISRDIKVVFPVHPRTRKQIEKLGFSKYYNRNMKLLEPLSYLEFLKLYSNASVVLTDSGGLQEETSALDVPCLTLRENTERPITIERGTNILVGTDEKSIVQETDKILKGERKRKKRLELWDGKVSGRIIEVLVEQLCENRVVSSKNPVIIEMNKQLCDECV